jgi:hypothetical protein
VNQETQQKYHDYNESKSIEYFFNGFDSLDIVDGGELSLQKVDISGCKLKRGGYRVKVRTN